jgi:hydroxymethylbilane synthase
MQKIRLGTRKSKLAIAQTNIVMRVIESTLAIECEPVYITTSGDINKTKPLYEIGGKGLFIKEIEEALLTKEIDIAVHSLKDVPGVIPDSLMIAAMLEREDSRDVLLCEIARTIQELPHGAKIGTTSPRRIIYLRKLRPDLDIVTLRGNLDSRYQKLMDGEFDGAIVAIAGLKRLYSELDHEICHPIPVTDMLPAIGQGVIGLEIRRDDDRIRGICSKINHQPTWDLMMAERAFLEHLEASCRTPAAALAVKTHDGMKVDFMLATDDWQNVITETASCSLKEGYELGKKMAIEMKGRLSKNDNN